MLTKIHRWHWSHQMKGEGYRIPPAWRIGSGYVSYGPTDVPPTGRGTQRSRLMPTPHEFRTYEQRPRTTTGNQSCRGTSPGQILGSDKGTIR